MGLSFTERVVHDYLRRNVSWRKNIGRERWFEIDCRKRLQTLCQARNDQQIATNAGIGAGGGGWWSRSSAIPWS
jgi:hypothetical protein